MKAVQLDLEAKRIIQRGPGSRSSFSSAFDRSVGSAQGTDVAGDRRLSGSASAKAILANTARESLFRSAAALCPLPFQHEIAGSISP
ncbi:hypothetical protein [Rhizobium ruizarguesonis]|uniref:hypothetical protein n=1 Tax=Rhizobium ruizarguesonis TaxID=2081791 RepID=UPI00371786CD